MAAPTHGIRSYFLSHRLGPSPSFFLDVSVVRRPLNVISAGEKDEEEEEKSRLWEEEGGRKKSVFPLPFFLSPSHKRSFVSVRSRDEIVGLGWVGGP